MTKSYVAQHVSVEVGPNNGCTVGPDLAEGMQSANKVLEQAMDARILAIPGLIDRLRTEGYSLHLLLVPGKMSGPLVAIAPHADQTMENVVRAGVLGETVRALRRLAHGKSWDVGTMAATIDSELRDALNAVELRLQTVKNDGEALKRESDRECELRKAAQETVFKFQSERNDLQRKLDVMTDVLKRVMLNISEVRDEPGPDKATKQWASDLYDSVMRTNLLRGTVKKKVDAFVNARADAVMADGLGVKPANEPTIPTRVSQQVVDGAAKLFNEQMAAIDRVLSDPKCDVDEAKFPTAHRVSTLVKTVLHNWERGEQARQQYSDELNVVHRLIEWRKNPGQCPEPPISAGMNVAQTFYDWATMGGDAPAYAELDAVRDVLDGKADTFVDYQLDASRTPIAYSVWRALAKLREGLAAAAKPKNSYLRQIKVAGINIMGEGDVYEVVLAFKVICPARVGAIKKLLCAGDRMGGKDVIRDLTEARDGCDRAIELAKLAS